MLETLPEFWPFLASLLVGFLAGLVKGLVGFALPLVLVSGLGAFLPPEMALAGIVVPAILTNVWQSLRQGPRSAAQSLWAFRVFLGVGLVVLLFSAQLVPIMSESTLFLALGIPIITLSLAQLSGWRPAIARDNRLAEVVAGMVFGVLGGFAAFFGPALVFYLTAIGTPKTEQVRLQGVVFALGAILFGAAHVVSGIVSWDSLTFSLLITLPSLLGLAIGFRLHDKVDQETFRTLTLVVLLLSGLNLLRKATIG